MDLLQRMAMFPALALPVLVRVVAENGRVSRSGLACPFMVLVLPVLVMPVRVLPAALALPVRVLPVRADGSVATLGASVGV